MSSPPAPLEEDSVVANRIAARFQSRPKRNSKDAATQHEYDCSSECKGATLPELASFATEQKSAMVIGFSRMQAGQDLIQKAMDNLERVISSTPGGLEELRVWNSELSGLSDIGKRRRPFGRQGSKLRATAEENRNNMEETYGMQSNAEASTEKGELNQEINALLRSNGNSVTFGTEGEPNRQTSESVTFGSEAKPSRETSAQLRSGSSVTFAPEFDKDDGQTPIQRSPSEDEPESARLSRVSTGGFGQAIKFKHTFSSEGEDLTERQVVRKILENGIFQSISISLILFTVVLICMDTDARARNSTTDPWVDIAMFVCFVAYFLEFSATLYVERSAAFYSHWNYIDGFVITSNSVDYLIQLCGVEGISLLQLIRICRLLRLGRIIRALRLLQTVKWFKEQYLMMVMMASCVRTLCWAFLFCFFIMTIWSILAVELLNDIVIKLDTSTSVWQGCARCGRSFGSIWESNLTFMQTIIAGDSWGTVALPVIEDSWWAVFIFLGALSTVIFGVLNMISVVVIDTFADRRSKDLSHAANELEYEEIEERKKLSKMFEKIDEDNSGALSVEELREGAEKVKEFHQYLRVLDIDDKDLVDLFHMIDNDGSGEVDPDEFIDALYRMKRTESKTATRFVKHMVANLFDSTQALDTRLDLIQTSVTNKIGAVEMQLRLDMEEKPCEESVQNLLEEHISEVNTIVAGGIERALSTAFQATMRSAVRQTSETIQEVVATSACQVAAMSDRLRLNFNKAVPSKDAIFSTPILADSGGVMRRCPKATNSKGTHGFLLSLGEVKVCNGTPGMSSNSELIAC